MSHGFFIRYRTTVLFEVFIPYVQRVDGEGPMFPFEKKRQK